MSTEAVVRGTRVNENQNEEEARLCLIANNICFDTYYTFLVYRPLSSNDYIVKAGTMQLAIYGAWKATVLTCFV